MEYRLTENMEERERRASWRSLPARVFEILRSCSSLSEISLSEVDEGVEGGLAVGGVWSRECCTGGGAVAADALEGPLFFVPASTGTEGGWGRINPEEREGESLTESWREWSNSWELSRQASCHKEPETSQEVGKEGQ